MCKIMVMPHIPEDKVELAWNIAKAMGKVMSKGNSDGLGYAAIDADGKIFGERWLRNSEAFETRVEFTDLDRIMLEDYGGFLHKDERYNNFGVLNPDKTRALMLHARYATSGKEFYNTHPFLDAGTVLIHNGVISNVDQKELKVSTCDSEKILQQYIKNNVANKPKAMQRVANSLHGYYACAVMSHDKQNKPVLDVFKDNSANLGAAFVRELGAVVITTNPGDLVSVASDLKLHIDSIYEVKAGVLIRFDVLSGKPVGATKFNPRSSYRKSSYNGFHDMEDYGTWRSEYNKRHGDGWPDGGTGSVTNGYQGKYGGTYLPKQAGDKDESKGNVVPLRMTNSASEDGWEYNEKTKTWKRI